MLRTQSIFQHPFFCTYHCPNFHLPEGRVQCLEIFRAIHFVFFPPCKCCWLRHYATSLQVTGSITDGVIGIFHWHNPSGRNRTLGSTQPLTETSTKNISRGVKAAGVYGWKPYHLHAPIALKSRNLNFLKPSRPVQACIWIALPVLLPFP